VQTEESSTWRLARSRSTMPDAKHSRACQGSPNQSRAGVLPDSPGRALQGCENDPSADRKSAFSQWPEAAPITNSALARFAHSLPAREWPDFGADSQGETSRHRGSCRYPCIAMESGRIR
jgi:hypothetical protein